MGGGGGDGGYEARQQQIETSKDKARAALNALFGEGSNAPEDIASVLGPAPDRAKFTAPTKLWAPVGGSFEDFALVDGPGTVDEAGYAKAKADYDAQVQGRQNALATNAQSRDGLYQQVREGAFTAGKRSLDEGKQEAARKTKFELFARGLNGASEDIDQNSKLNRTYNQGLIDLGAKADSAKAQFRNADEDTRLQLLQSIDNGMDTGSALSAATNRMKIAADQASADAQGTSLGNLFDTSGLIYSQSQAAKGRQAGQEWWNQYSNPSKRAGSAPTGVSSRLPGE